MLHLPSWLEKALGAIFGTGTVATILSFFGARRAAKERQRERKEDSATHAEEYRRSQEWMEMRDAFNGMSTLLDRVQGQYADISKKYDDLSQKYDRLLKDHRELQESYDGLSKSYDALQLSYKTLAEQATAINLTLTNYDTISREAARVLEDASDVKPSLPAPASPEHGSAPERE